MPRWGVSSVCAVVLLIGVLVAAPVQVARADGDPASDYLLANQVFLTSQSATVSPAQRQLLATVRSADRAGFAIRVAVIADQYDLGSITALWGKPGLYARFLGLELSSAYRQRLLVVMPNGFGFNWPGHPAAGAERLVAAVPLGAGGDRLAVAAQAAVRRLAAASGVTLAAPRPGAAVVGTGSGAGDIPVIVGAVVGGLALFAALAAGVLRARRRRPRRVLERARPPVWSRRLASVPLRWAVPAVAVLVAAAVGLSLRAVRGGGAQLSPASIVTPPPFTWRAGARPAPAFVLRDQAGQPVSVGEFRGRPVIVTFIDPLCRNLCPLEAQVLNQLERQLPASERPVILAVSVDVYANANSRADLLRDVREWHLVPQWRWAVGRPAQLAAVWRRYEIGVSVVTKRIASTAIHYITHTEGAYIVDSSGHERALFLWPFYPQDVRRVLRRLA
jgi:cytochrome oxidase Cu insertion factor (SCO1/SenC/PrrC family)